MTYSFKMPEDDTKILKFLYHTAVGRIILKALCAPALSKISGAFLSSVFSKPLISPFIRKNNIDMSEYVSDGFRCFNDCFTRKIRDGARPVDLSPAALISPCDAYLSAYHISDDTVLSIKHSRLSIDKLLESESAAEAFGGGICLVFRLCVNHYHRYCCFDNGKILYNKFSKGVLHTVRPIALDSVPVFNINSREITVFDTENFGRAAQVEVGAMLVGKIKNYKTEGSVKRGEEKGMFLYGGSTIVLLLEKGRADIDKEIFDASARGLELPVKLGEKIGSAKQPLRS